MRHQPWDPFSANSSEAGCNETGGNLADDLQGELLVLAAFIQGFSEQIAEVFPEEQMRERWPCSQGKP